MHFSDFSCDRFSFAVLLFDFFLMILLYTLDTGPVFRAHVSSHDVLCQRGSMAIGQDQEAWSAGFNSKRERELSKRTLSKLTK